VPFFEIFRQGLEDPRLVVTQKGLRALVAYGRRAARKAPTRLADEKVETVGAFRQALMSLDHSQPEAASPRALRLQDMVPLHTDFDHDAQQKNWMPFVFDGIIYVVDQLTPRVKILKLDEDTGSTSLAYESESDPALHGLRADVRGGSQFVHVPSEGLFLGVAHVTRGRSMYTHFFIALQDRPPFTMLGVSREWCLAHEESFQSGKEVLCEGVQFISGLAFVGEGLAVSDGDADGKQQHKPPQQVVLSYGVMDCDARLANFKFQSVLKSIRFARPQQGVAHKGGDEL